MIMDLSSMPDTVLTFKSLLAFERGESLYAIRQAFGAENAESMRQGFLRPSIEAVSTVPCKTFSKEVCGRYCRRQILYSSELQRIVAYCPKFCATDEQILEQEVNVYFPDINKLLRNSAEALKLRPGFSMEAIDGVWRIGEISPSAARKYPVFFIFHGLSDVIQAKIQQLLLEYNSGPIVIFCPLETKLDSSTLRLLQNRRSLLLDIDQCVLLSFDGSVSPKIEPQNIFNSLLDSKDKKVDLSFGYDFPYGTSWEDLLIHCQDDPEKVSLKIGATTSVYTRTEMKIGKKQWYMLYAFAEKFGCLPSTEILQNDAMKKQRERLNSGLKDFFHTTEDAIVLSEDQSEYICRFKLKPSWHSTIHHTKKRTS